MRLPNRSRNVRSEILRKKNCGQQQQREPRAATDEASLPGKTNHAVAVTMSTISAALASRDTSRCASDLGKQDDWRQERDEKKYVIDVHYRSRRERSSHVLTRVGRRRSRTLDVLAFLTSSFSLKLIEKTMKLKVTIYLDVISSWCFWAEPAWEELKKRYADRRRFRMEDRVDGCIRSSRSRIEQAEWFYRRSGMMMRSPFMLSRAGLNLIAGMPSRPISSRRRREISGING